MKHKWKCNLCTEHKMNGGAAKGMSKSWSTMAQVNKSLRTHSKNKHNGKIDAILFRKDGVEKEVKR